MQLKLGHRQVIRTLTISISLMLLIPTQAVAQSDSSCSFNGKIEPCLIQRTAARGYKVTWLTDGKIVTYTPYDCRPIAAGAAERCQVRIVEDNGQISGGTIEMGGAGVSIESSNGNHTLLR